MKTILPALIALSLIAPAASFAAKDQQTTVAVGYYGNPSPLVTDVPTYQFPANPNGISVNPTPASNVTVTITYKPDMWSPSWKDHQCKINPSTGTCKGTFVIPSSSLNPGRNYIRVISHSAYAFSGNALTDNCGASGTIQNVLYDQVKYRVCANP